MLCAIIGCEKQAKYPFVCCSVTHGLEYKAIREYVEALDNPKLTDEEKENYKPYGLYPEAEAYYKQLKVPKQ